MTAYQTNGQVYVGTSLRMCVTTPTKLVGTKVRHVRIRTPTIPTYNTR